MTKFEPVLNLSVDNLKERREQLETELSKVVNEQVTTGLKEYVNDILAKANITNATSLTWEFYPESDDEGGTDWHVNDLYLRTNDDEDIDMDEIEFEVESTYRKGELYTVSLRDELYDMMYGFRDDLYEQGIEEITL